jgi:curved DNA-binding protein CbpA
MFLDNDITAALLLLGIQPNPLPSKRAIKKAFRQLSLKYHPDKGGSTEAFQRLKAAHDLVLPYGSDHHDSDAASSIQQPTTEHQYQPDPQQYYHQGHRSADEPHFNERGGYCYSNGGSDDWFSSEDFEDEYAQFERNKMERERRRNADWEACGQDAHFQWWNPREAPQPTQTSQETSPPQQQYQWQYPPREFSQENVSSDPLPPESPPMMTPQQPFNQENNQQCQNGFGNGGMHFGGNTPSLNVRQHREQERNNQQYVNQKCAAACQDMQNMYQKANVHRMQKKKQFFVAQPKAVKGKVTKKPKQSGMAPRKDTMVHPQWQQQQQHQALLRQQQFWEYASQHASQQQWQAQQHEHQHMKFPHLQPTTTPFQKAPHHWYRRY